MENLIEELTKVNPSNLSEEGLKLFNKINEIIDRNKELKERNIYLVNERKKLEELLFMSNENYIEKSLIKEKIEEYKAKIDCRYCNNSCDRYAVCKVLEELLKGE